MPKDGSVHVVAVFAIDLIQKSEPNAMVSFVERQNSNDLNFSFGLN